jgi:hypothetical protein
MAWSLSQGHITPILDCARRPVHTLRLVSYKLYEMRHPDEPWISQGAIRFCDAHLKRDQAGLEWGSGRSTKWYAERLGRLLSIEFDPGWHGRVVREIKGYSNVECRFIPPDHPLDQPTVRDYDPVPSYVAAADEFPDSSLDFVVVDGHYRHACVRQVLAKIKPGGLLLIDNTDWAPLPEWGVPPTWPVVHQSSNVMTQTTIWRKPDIPQGV